MSCAQETVVNNRIIFPHGDSHTIDVYVQKKDPQNAKKLIPVDLTNATSVLSVKAKESDTTYAVQITGAVIDPTGGVLEFTFTPVDTAALPASVYVYDIRVTLPGGVVYTVIRDVLKLESTVTQLPGVLAQIVITPLNGSVAVGQILQFSAIGKDAVGNIIPITPSWSVIAGGGGINSSTGLFTAGGTPGTFTNTIRCVQGVVSAAASVVVTP